MKIKQLLKSEIFWLIFIFLLGALLRFYKLGQIPSGFVSDEANFGYNAYSLIKTSKDEFGQLWPIIFHSFGDGKMPIYFYLTIPSILIFGLTEFAVRFPSALLGSLTVIFIYFFAKELLKLKPATQSTRWRTKLIPLISALTLAVMPWHIHFSRAAFEANIGLFWIALGSWLFLKFVNSKKYFSLIFSLISFTLAIFSYHAPRIFIPLWLIYLALYFIRDFSKVHRLKIIIFIIVILFTPWLLLSFSKQSLLRAGGISIFHQQSGVMQRLQQKFTETNNQPLWLTRGLHNKPVEFSLDFTRRYFSHFDPDFLFFKGDPIRPRYRAPDIGQALLFTLPFFFIGLYLLASHGYWLILAWLLLAPIPSAFTFETPSAIRSLIMIFPLAFIIALGISGTINFLLKKHKLFPKIILGIGLLVFTYNFIFYLDAYFIHMPVREPYEWQGGYKQLVNKVTQLMPNYEKAEITAARGTPYIYFLFYNQYDPNLWHQQANDSISIDPKFQYISIGKLDNLYFEGNTCPANKLNSLNQPQELENNVLYVCTEENHPHQLINKGTVRIIDKINFDDGQPAFVLMAKP